jgi:hypothetical protein
MNESAGVSNFHFNFEWREIRRRMDKSRRAQTAKTLGGKSNDAGGILAA